MNHLRLLRTLQLSAAYSATYENKTYLRILFPDLSHLRTLIPLNFTTQKIYVFLHSIPCPLW